MPNPIRLPLVESVEPRLADVDKDGLASNIFFEKSSSGYSYATKRPGITVGATGSGYGYPGHGYC